MRFASTRGASPHVGFSAALVQGLAPDGGLYVPQQWPQFALDSWPAAAALPALAEPLLQRFAEGDALVAQAGDIVGDDAFHQGAQRSLRAARRRPEAARPHGGIWCVSGWLVSAGWAPT